MQDNKQKKLKKRGNLKFYCKFLATQHWIVSTSEKTAVRSEMLFSENAFILFAIGCKYINC